MRIILNRPNEIPTVTDAALERRLRAIAQLRAAQMRAYSDAIHGFSDNPVRDRLLAEWMQRRAY